MTPIILKQLHTQLVFHMRSNIPGDRFYFICDPLDDGNSFVAIAGVMLYNRLDANKKIQVFDV